jgi:hypothetical protein
MSRLRLGQHILISCTSQSQHDYGFAKCSVYGSRKETKVVGDNIWWTLRSRIKYRYFVNLLSNTGGIDGYYHRASVFAANVNWNADNRKWNCNAYRLDDNRWDAGNRAFSQLNVFSSLNVGSF